jgi:hypothetical protein
MIGFGPYKSRIPKEEQISLSIQKKQSKRG